MNKVREMVLRAARDQWVGMRNAQHATKSEKDLAELAIEEIGNMEREARAPRRASRAKAVAK